MTKQKNQTEFKNTNKKTTKKTTDWSFMLNVVCMCCMCSIDSRQLQFILKLFMLGIDDYTAYQFWFIFQYIQINAFYYFVVRIMYFFNFIFR